MKTRLMLILLTVVTLFPLALPAQTAADNSGKPFVIEYYYKV
jgi:hypothetical protein